MTRRPPLHSPDWYRVAPLRPRVRPGVKISRQLVRGAPWYVFSDPTSGRHHRFNKLAYRLVASCDGQRTVDEVWNARAASDGEHAISQGEAIRILSLAFEANLIVADVTPDAEAIVARGKQARRRRAASAVNPLSFRVPLWDPDKFVGQSVHYVRWIFTGGAALVCVLTALLGLLLWMINARELAAFAAAQLPTTGMLIALWIAYPCIKLLHELGHAFAVKTFGGDVREMGVTLLFLTPVPYVDASASTAFPEKWERAAVAAAGIMVELVIAAIALVVWLAADGGWLRDLAFAVALIGGVSTVLVNGNPLLRFDGYFVLCDLFELPNLAARSNSYWRHLAKRHLLGLRRISAPALESGERPWLMLYAPLAWVYRCLLFAFFVLVLAQYNAAAALAVAAMGAAMLIGWPALRALVYLVDGRELVGQRARAVAIGLALLTAVGGAVFAVPLPQVTFAPGIVWLQDDATVRAGVEGFIEKFAARDGEPVIAGAVIAQLSNDQLPIDLERVSATLKQHDVERAVRHDAEPMRVAVLTDKIDQLRAEQRRLEQKNDALSVRADGDGTAALDRAQDALGRFVEQGEVIGHLLGQGAPLVRVLVRNEDIALVRERPNEVQVRLASETGTVHSARIERTIPQATRELPSEAMGEQGGGSIATDASDPSGKTALEAWFHFDLRLAQAIAAPIGARVLVTFRHGDATLAQQLLLLARRTFLRHFER
ncbi:MAG: site-2 protease family protein [Burkholderiales bacterium]